MQIKNQKKFALLTAVAVLLSAWPSLPTRAEQGERRTFITTAYYSPLPDQAYYLTGSYESEIRLNGRGTNGADGTEVYPGMLAAPKSYPFGTQIFIDGLGLGTVHDRGGAIVPAGERGHSHDRIDIWMGKGEAGLARALQWGKRTVEATVYFDGGQSGGFDFSSVPQIPLKRLPKAPPPAERILTLGARGDEIITLQKDLTELGFYANEITGYYGELTRAAVFRFQLDAGVLGNAETKGAGDFGPRTSAALTERLRQKHEALLKELEAILPALQTGLEPGAAGEAVTGLQTVLYHIGLLKKQPTGVYDDSTREAVLAFQMEAGLVGTPQNLGAGVFGPKTKASLLAMLQERQMRLQNSSPAIAVTAEFAGTVTPPLEDDTPHPSASPEPGLPSGSVLAGEFPAEQGGTAVAAGAATSRSQSQTFE